MTNFLKTSFGSLTAVSSTASPVDLGKSAFISDDGEYKIKLDLSISEVTSMLFNGGSYLQADSVFKYPSISYYNNDSDAFTIDFWQFTNSNANNGAEMLFSISEKDSSDMTISNLIPGKTHNFDIKSYSNGKLDLIPGINPYRDSWGGDATLFGNGEFTSVAHPNGNYSDPNETGLNNIIKNERGRIKDSHAGTSIIVSSNGLDSQITTDFSLSGWFQTIDPLTTSSSNKIGEHTYEQSNRAYFSIDDGFDNLAMVHPEGIRIRGLDWSYNKDSNNGSRPIVNKHLKWEAIGANISLTNPAAGIINVSNPIDPSTSTYNSNYLVPDSDRVYVTNYSINSNYLTGKRNIITTNFDVYNDATFASYMWIDSDTVPNDGDTSTMFKIGGDYEALEIKAVNSGGTKTINASADNGSLSTSIPLPDTSNLLSTDGTLGPESIRGNRWVELRWSVQLQPAKITLMAKKIPTQPSTSNDYIINSHQPSTTSGIRRWASNDKGISEYNVLKNQANGMGSFYKGNVRAYETDPVFIAYYGSNNGQDPFRTDNSGNLFFNFLANVRFNYNILKYGTNANDKITISNCGTISSPNYNGRVIYFEYHQEGRAGNVVRAFGEHFQTNIHPFVVSSNMVQEGTSNSATGTINTYNNSKGQLIRPRADFPISLFFPKQSSSDAREHVLSFIIDEQIGHLFTFKDGVFHGAQDFMGGNISGETYLELGFSTNQKVSLEYLVGFYTELFVNKTQQGQPNFNGKLHGQSWGTGAYVGQPNGPYTGSRKAQLEDSVVRKNSEFKIAFCSEDWVYDVPKIVNEARINVGAPAYLNDGIYYNNSTVTKNPTSINYYLTNTSTYSVTQNNVKKIFLDNEDLPLKDGLIYFDKGYHPTSSNSFTDEYQNSIISWGGRSVKHKGTDHGINRARRYILRTNGSIVSRNTSQGVDLTTFIAGMTDGDCLLLDPGHYTITGTNGGTLENIASNAPQLGYPSLVTPLGQKNIMICGNTDDVASVHITYDPAVTVGPTPIFGPHQHTDTQLAFLTFKKLNINATAWGSFGGHTTLALTYMSTGAKAYKVHFDFDGAEEITWCWSASGSRKHGTKTIFDMCVFSNYKKLKDESTYLNGTNIISNVELKDPIFSKSSGMNPDVLDGISVNKYTNSFEQTTLSPWWNNNDFSSISDSNIITSPFKGYAVDLQYQSNVDSNIGSITDGPLTLFNVKDKIGDSQDNKKNIILQYTQPLNIQLSGDPWNTTTFSSLKDTYNKININSDSNNYEIYSTQSEQGGVLLALDTLGQVTVKRNVNYGYSTPVQNTWIVEGRDSTCQQNGTDFGWTHTGLVIDSDKIEVYKDGSLFNNSFLVTKHLSVKNAVLRIGAGNETGRNSSLSGVKTLNVPEEFTSYNGYITDFRIRPNVHSITVPTQALSPSSPETLLLNSQENVINTSNVSKGVTNIGSVSLFNFNPYIQGTNWFTYGLHKLGYTQVQKRQLLTLGGSNPPPLLTSNDYGELYFNDSTPSWNEIVDSGEVGYRPGIQAKVALYNIDDSNERIDWNYEAKQFLEPIVDITKDSQLNYSNFYFNDRYDSDRNGIPGSVFIKFTGKNKATGNPSAIFLGKERTKLKGPLEITAMYDRISNEFTIIDYPTDHVFRFITPTLVPQGGFATEGISAFDSYSENILLFQIIDSTGQLI